MPDYDLKLRVSVETATISELQAELKRLKDALADLRPDDPQFKEAEKSIAQLDDRLKELRSGYKEFSQAQTEVKESVAETALSIDELSAKLKDSTISIAERAAIERQLATAIKESSTAQEAIAGKYAEEQKLISQSKDLRAEATKELLSSSAKVLSSYFLNGDALRKLALESGGYVTKLQAESLATQLSKEQNISLAQAADLVTQRLKEEGLAQQTLAQFIRETRQENRLQNFVLNESRGAINSLSGGIGILSGQLGEQTATLRGISTSLSSGINMFQGLDFTVKGLGQSLKINTQAFASLSLGIVGMVALASSVYSFFSELSKRAKAAAESIKQSEQSIIDLKLQLGEITPSAYIEALIRQTEEAKTRIEKLRKEEKEAQESANMIKGAPRDPLGSSIHQILQTSYTEAVAERKKAEESLFALEVKLNEYRKSIGKELTDMTKKQVDEQKKLDTQQQKDTEQAIKILEQKGKAEQDNLNALFPLVEKANKQREEILRWYLAIEEATETGKLSELELMATENMRLKILKDMADLQAKSVDIKPPKKEEREFGFEETLAIGKSKDFAQNALVGIDILTAGFSRLGDTIAREFVDKIIGATSLFQQFVGEVVAGIIKIAEQIAASAIISGILSLFGFGFGSTFAKLSPIAFAQGGIISEPVVGMGTRTGRSYTFAENMPERVSPLTSFGGHSEPMVIRIDGRFRADGRDMISSFKMARIIDRKTGGNL